MQAARYTQGGSLEVVEVAVPEIGRDELLLRVESAAICGTDLKILRHGHRKLRDDQTITLGHEFVGTIERAGSSVRGWTEGDRVGVAPNIGCGVCRMCSRGLPNMCQEFGAYGITFDGAHAAYVRVPAASLGQGSVVRLPSSVSPIAGALAEPLSCALSGVRVAEVGLGDCVLVYGAGPMGLLNLMLARHAGAARVIAVDRNDDRLKLAGEVGATDTINSARTPVTEWVSEHLPEGGVDAVILAVPAPDLQQEALELLLPFGRLCLFAGWSRLAGAVPLDTNPIHYKNLRVGGMTGGSPREYRDALDLISAGQVDVCAVVSDTFHLSDLAGAYERLQAGGGLKITLASDPARCTSGSTGMGVHIKGGLRPQARHAKNAKPSTEGAST